MLERLASDGEDVALIAADLRLPGMDGVAFLEQAQELHRDASRVSLLAIDQYHTRIPFTELATLQLATALGRILRTDHQPGQLGPSMLQDLLGDRRIKAFNDRFQLISKAQQAFSSGSLVQHLRRPRRRWRGRARCHLLRSDAADLDAVFPCLAISLPRCRRSRMQSID